MDPLGRLQKDRSLARQRQDPWAELCVLATVTADDEPSARVLVLRDLELRAENGSPSTPQNPALGIFVNASAPKVAEFSRSSTVAVLIYLPSVAVQYRLRCTLDPIDPAVVRTAWQMRPEVAKRMDWVYETHPQSTEIASRRALLDAVRSDAIAEPLVAPQNAIGFALQPVEVERLDLDSVDAPHDRRRYSAGESDWVETVLVP